MSQYVATEVVKLMIKRGTPVKGAKLVTPDVRERSETNVAGGINPGLTSGVLMLGITFKENCLPTVALAKEGPDIRNTKAIDIYRELREYDIDVDVYDPWANPAEVKHEYNINILGSSNPPSFGGEGGGFYAAIILAVAHNEFMKINLQEQKNLGCIIYDVKGILNQAITDGRL